MGKKWGKWEKEIKGASCAAPWSHRVVDVGELHGELALRGHGLQRADQRDERAHRAVAVQAWKPVCHTSG